MQYKTKKLLIYQKLREEILNGQYEFGEKLVISRLAKRFESSEIPIREAMNQLEAEKLIEFKPHTGAIVSTLSLKDIQEIFELRVELEGLATRLAAEALTKETLKELREILDDSRVAFKNKKYERFEELNIEFHLKIYSECDNQLLFRTIKDLWSNTNRYPSLFKENDSHIKLSMQEHEEIYSALTNKDGMLAENSMIRHKARAGKEILRVKQWDFYNRLNGLIEENK
ncbi:GntR family transcriptional regulator [Neobacillus terrae]|uniref:GntR family transcriptional regulator n=1 Tax=Neobacillus terrae TaxID=3034837 RepID=UPI00140B0C2D|nr:GntR family transcriptional regulator [Neobacillus terrae]NHM32892.1 GntR family transcriptional regulator [Neobacillus terrae]